MSTGVDVPVLESAQELHHREKNDSPVDSNSLDEKFANEKAGHEVNHTVDDADLGDVYEDVRAIDLDSNGKEKPIGMFI